MPLRTSVVVNSLTVPHLRAFSCALFFPKFVRVHMPVYARICHYLTTCRHTCALYFYCLCTVGWLLVCTLPYLYRVLSAARAFRFIVRDAFTLPFAARYVIAFIFVAATTLTPLPYARFGRDLTLLPAVLVQFGIHGSLLHLPHISQFFASLRIHRTPYPWFPSHSLPFTPTLL